MVRSDQLMSPDQNVKYLMGIYTLHIITVNVVIFFNSIQFNSILYFRLNIILHKVVHSGYIKKKIK